MIVEAARVAGCDTVLTEDLSAGAVIRGVRVENPFGAALS
jgi:predicted nucleic acid-binding protein